MPCSATTDTVVLTMVKRSPGVRKRAQRKPRHPHVDPPAVAAPAGARWLLLIHQIPPKPDYLRVKIGRRLQRVGAVAIKNSVYALPPTSESYEDFQWIVREVMEGGGDAFVSEASLVGVGLTDDQVRARFDAARSAEYRAIMVQARSLLTIIRRAARTADNGRSGAKRNMGRVPVEQELAKLRRRYEIVNGVDFFGAAEGVAVAALLSEMQQTISQRRGKTSAHEPASRLDGATWVTRQDIHVDRIASAWLIRRFIDRRPRFRYVDPKHHTHRAGELRFDMFEAEYTHVGDACTFEALISAFVPSDPVLREIAELVHDVDCKDGKFRRDEAPGLARMIAGIAALYPRDDDRSEHGGRMFDALYAAFGGGGILIHGDTA